ncbi:MAG TPA: VWA domain-containing protein, partial [Planctomycetota bacterium]|nr:VWA domain-containing protein [Planctomycetota bacterium]
FGRDAAIEGRVGKESPIRSPSAVIDPDGTDVGGALRLAAATFREGAGRRIVLVTDGNETEGDAAREVEALRAQGIVVDVLPVRYKYDKEVMVERVVGPQAARTGEPFTLRATVRSLTRTRGKLLFREDDEIIGAQEVELEPGMNVFTFTRTATERGAHRFSASIEATDDTIAYNNAAEHLIFVRGEGVTLYAPGPNGPTQPLLDALAAQKIRVRVVRASDLPADLGGYSDADAVILDDVPAEDLSKQQQAVLESAVHDLGLGLLMLGGDHAFGPGGWLGTPVEKALPVDMDVKQKKVIPKGALVMILHTCEFQDGNVWAVKIASAAIDALSSQDEVGLIDYGFQAGEEWVFKLQQAANKTSLKNRVRGAMPGDMPSFDSTVQMAHDGLAKSEASLKHILVITDGDPTPPNPGLISKMRNRKITMSAVAINPHGGRNGPEVAALADVVKATGGRFYYVEDPKQLPQIFMKEAVSISRSLVVEEKFRAVGGVPTEVLKGLAVGELPPLGGYVMTTPKDRAQIGLLTHKGDPLLAQWQYGVGKAAAFTSSASARWAAAWIGFEGYKAFYEQLVRAIAREVAETPFDLNGDVVGGKGTIVLDAIDEQGRFVNFLEVEARIATPKLEHRSVKLEQTAPGRYEAHFDAREGGTFFANVVARDRSGKLVAASGLAIQNPYSLEYRKIASDERLLARLAELGKGRVLKLDDPVFVHDVPAERAPRETWPFLLGLAACLLPLDVAIRRLVIDWPRVRARLAALVGRRAPLPAAGSTETLARLRGVKDKEERKLAESVRAAADDAARRGSAAAPQDKLGSLLHDEKSGAPTASYEKPAAPPSAAQRAADLEKKLSQDKPESTDALSRLLKAKKKARGEDEEKR